MGAAGPIRCLGPADDGDNAASRASAAALILKRSRRRPLHQDRPGRAARRRAGLRLEGDLEKLVRAGLGQVLEIEPHRAGLVDEADRTRADGAVPADRLRVIGADGTNLRINVDDGAVTKDGNLKFADTDMHKGETPKVVAGAYSNSLKSTKETALYDI